MSTFTLLMDFSTKTSGQLDMLCFREMANFNLKELLSPQIK